MNLLTPNNIKATAKFCYTQMLRLISMILIICTVFPSYSNAQPSDTTSVNQIELNALKNDFSTDFMHKAELEHQKILRNIFAASLILFLVLLVFTLFFYGNKIKKISQIIVLQSDALNATKDQLMKIINIYNYLDQQVYITDSKGTIEWMNFAATERFKEPYETEKTNIIKKFSTENQGILFSGITENKSASFNDNLFGNEEQWKMIPIQNSKGEFSNMVFIS